MVFTFQKRVYGYECDSYGHMNNASYLNLLEAARSEALYDMKMSIKNLKEKGIFIYLTHLEIDYIKGLQLEDIISVKTWIDKGNRMRAIWIQEVYNSKQELCSRASIHGAFVKDGRPYRLPADEYEVYLPYVKTVL